MSNVTVLLDVDGVLVESNHHNLHRVNETFGTSYKFEEIQDFGYSHMEPEHREFLYEECWHDPHLYDNVALSELQENVLEGLREFCRVVACSSPLLGHIQSKYLFLSQYFDRSDIILASDKNLVKGDILIDDGVHNLGEFQGYTICYDQPWNQEWPGPRAHSFEDIGPLVIDWMIDNGYLGDFYEN